MCSWGKLSFESSKGCYEGLSVPWLMSLYRLKWAKTGWKNSAVTQIGNLRFVILIPPSSFPFPGVRSFLLHSISSLTEFRPLGFLFCREEKENTLHKYFNSLSHIECEELHYPGWLEAASWFATKFIEIKQSSSSKRWKLSEFCIFFSDVEVLKGPVLIHIALLEIWVVGVSAKLSGNQAVTN